MGRNQSIGFQHLLATTSRETRSEEMRWQSALDLDPVCDSARCPVAFGSSCTSGEPSAEPVRVPNPVSSISPHARLRFRRVGHVGLWLRPRTPWITDQANHGVLLIGRERESRCREECAPETGKTKRKNHEVVNGIFRDKAICSCVLGQRYCAHPFLCQMNIFMERRRESGNRKEL